ncbi:RidA family protein [Marinobacter litoralis]|uniref:Enamine/imine deaminase n=1 Tax=Marinobacter litoralis TaxID=187981 RepID=A0A3M2R8G7_9GAMM|nr:RidA family protein [Marinobacter litoralis]MBJ6137896.1 RidA family protein [Marinobacter litoralis]MBR9871673.1 RidA family protein [Gammaproteobacteria bacterium]RMJ01583.1 Enamine/imine deaminase [Marinobacter litoralis]
MVKTVKTELYASPSPLEWATIGNGILFTAQIPIDDKGKVVDGGIEAQTRQTMENLRHTLECANANLTDVTQVLIYVTDRSHLPVVNKIYAEYFEKPYPNRAALVIAGLAREEMLVELVVYATVED